MSTNERKLVGLAILPIVASVLLGLHHEEAAALDLNAKDKGNYCDPPTEDCVILTVPAPDKLIRSTCDHIRQASESQLAERGRYWIAADAPCAEPADS
ncbi:hypothetical protein [Paraliomyxa miuraensis]|uniref:hypothetical protein n=1 Tax=Paraliomyxa miuraensis TaxID=376150 RepID=UPI00224F0794|nr:hypothetical protein [Paraliomyxa miuraensis]MCX4240747.1 hypothetical protein [Paraliomyxa miuraensis]